MSASNKSKTLASLMTQLHYAWLEKTSPVTGQVPNTHLLFSIHDDKEMGWYRFDEVPSEAFVAARVRELEMQRRRPLLQGGSSWGAWALGFTRNEDIFGGNYWGRHLSLRTSFGGPAT